ncbi:hypothetical protein [Nostoc sp. DedSLP04]|uniref:hypothetical protein n=1 Tax=Nostoc sp. DedSLP04 TaxID=3075401 RepID=UPI002AD3F7D1|nr:hypothetical protein [Nostoc sp. DedSLP04]MDZ8034041.1 hypothetical protein [Nostoc sp. DedSLP04]
MSVWRSLSKKCPNYRDIGAVAPFGKARGRVFSYNQRKTKTGFQSLSPLREEEWKRGKKLCYKTRNQDLGIFVFSYENSLPFGKPGGEFLDCIPVLKKNFYKSQKFKQCKGRVISVNCHGYLYLYSGSKT